MSSDCAIAFDLSTVVTSVYKLAGGTGAGVMMDANKSAPPDILAETENMLNQGIPLTEVVKMLANEVQRLSTLLQPRA